MSRLSSQAEDALNETRMLILGAQVLVGFAFQAVFQPGFDRLPLDAQLVMVVGLAMMLVAVGVLIAPSAFHQIVEDGYDTPRVLAFTTTLASVALLPFAIGLGIEAYVAGVVVLGRGAGIALGVVATLFALVLWYGLEWGWRVLDRTSGLRPKEPFMEPVNPTSIESRIKQVLVEARVVLPGAQALLGFQLAAMLTDAFSELPAASQYVHLVSLVLLAMTIVLLMAPAAFHRIVERGEDTERLHRFATAMVLAALVTLGLGLAGDLYVVVEKVTHAPDIAISLAAASLVFFYGLWFGLTLVIRQRDQRRCQESAAPPRDAGPRTSPFEGSHDVRVGRAAR